MIGDDMMNKIGFPFFYVNLEATMDEYKTPIDCDTFSPMQEDIMRARIVAMAEDKARFVALAGRAKDEALLSLFVALKFDLLPQDEIKSLDDVQWRDDWSVFTDSGFEWMYDMASENNFYDELDWEFASYDEKKEFVEVMQQNYIDDGIINEFTVCGLELCYIDWRNCY